MTREKPHYESKLPKKAFPRFFPLPVSRVLKFAQSLEIIDTQYSSPLYIAKPDPKCLVFVFSIIEADSFEFLEPLVVDYLEQVRSVLSTIVVAITPQESKKNVQHVDPRDSLLASHCYPPPHQPVTTTNLTKN